MREYLNFIDGNWVEPSAGKYYYSINPANGKEYAKIPQCGVEDARKAVRAARAALPQWASLTYAARAKYLVKLAGLIRDNLRNLAEIETNDHGAPIRHTTSLHIPAAADFLEFFASAARATKGEVFPVGPQGVAYTVREPIGVVGVITPWNFPMLQVVWKLGAAIVMGNTVVVKPPSVTSCTALELAKLVESVGIPKGVVNIITGPGGVVGQELTTNPGIDKIGMTGETETGRTIMRNASSTVKQLTLELGGKNPFIVMDDADIEATVEGAVFAGFTNAGQVCSCASRVYVHEKVWDEFMDKFLQYTKEIVVGEPMSEATDMGPLVYKEHKEKVVGYIESGLREGAKIITGDYLPSDAKLKEGFYVMPTIFVDVKQDMKIMREEIFGPVVCCMKFKDFDEAIELANDTEYGLCASIWTQDVRKGFYAFQKINAGTVWINEHLITAPEQPWGGFGQSGFGKDCSEYALKEYTRVKSCFVDLIGGVMKKKPWYNIINPRQK